MEVTKLVAKASREIEAAFKVGGVSAAAEAFHPYAAFAGLIRVKLAGRIPVIFLERFLRTPIARRGA